VTAALRATPTSPDEQLEAAWAWSTGQPEAMGLPSPSSLGRSRCFIAKQMSRTDESGARAGASTLPLPPSDLSANWPDAGCFLASRISETRAPNVRIPKDPVPNPNPRFAPRDHAHGSAREYLRKARALDERFGAAESGGGGEAQREVLGAKECRRLHTRMHKRRNQRTDEAKVALYGPQGEERSNW